MGRDECQACRGLRGTFLSVDDVAKRQLSHWRGQYGVPGAAFWGLTTPQPQGPVDRAAGFVANPGFGTSDPSLTGWTSQSVLNGNQFGDVTGNSGVEAGSGGVGGASGGGAPA